MTQVLEHSKSQVRIAIDPHKSSWTAAAIDASLQLLAIVRVSVSDDGYRELRRFAEKWPNTHWAIEDATGLGAPLTHRLDDDGADVVDVPAKLGSAGTTALHRARPQGDDADAVSVGVAALTAQGLSTARMDAAVTALRAIVEPRDGLVKTRTQTVNRLHVVLTHLIHAGAPRGLSADRVGSIHRFRSAAAFANHTGTAPIQASSGDVVRHRLSRAGDRRLNCVLHTMAITQIGRETAGRTYIGGSEPPERVREALRCLKRRLSDVVYGSFSMTRRQSWRRAREDTPGRLYCPARPADTPHAGTSDQSLPEPTTFHPTTGPEARLDTERRRLDVPGQDVGSRRVDLKMGEPPGVVWLV